MAETISVRCNGKSVERKSDYITRYELIKNLPGSHMSGIQYKRYYPLINFEYSEITEG